jgi:nucleoside-diphosphate-sugar epimerase
MKTILLTGATGFVGRNIIKVLNKKKVNIIPVIRPKSKKKLDLKKIKNIKRIILSKDIFKENKLWWKDQCKGVDIIIHTAWFVEPGKYLKSIKNKQCLMGSLNLAKGAALAGVKRFIGIGTCFEYDLSFGQLSVNTPLNPMTPYARAKVNLYRELLIYFSKHPIDFLWCRLFYLYGEGEDKRRLVPYINNQIKNGKKVELTNKNYIRDYLKVSMAAKMIVEVALGKKKGAVNICSGVPITIEAFAKKIADKYQRRDLLNFGSKSFNSNDPPCVVGIPNCNF